MNSTVTPVPSEIPSPATRSATVVTGQTVHPGVSKRIDQRSFSSVFAQNQNVGKNPQAANAPAPVVSLQGNGYQKVEEEVGSEPSAAVVSGFPGPVVQEPSNVHMVRLDFLKWVDGQLSGVPRDASALLIPLQGSAVEQHPTQGLSGDSADVTLKSVMVGSQKSELSIQTGVKKIALDSDGQVLNDALSPRTPLSGMTAPGRIGIPAGGYTFQQTPVSPLEGFTRQSDPILSSYVMSRQSNPGVRPSGMVNGTGVTTGTLNQGVESGVSQQSESVTSILNADGTGAQEFGLDKEESQPRGFSLNQLRVTHLSASGNSSIFADVLGESSGSEIGALSRSKLVAERPSAFASSLPQRLQMEVTLADESRVQIDVAVQQRHVSAHLVTDQSLLRNLAVQQEGYLVGQLADAGLELKDFGAHIADQSANKHQGPGEGFNGRGSDTPGDESFPESPHQGLVGEMLSERGLHFVA